MTASPAIKTDIFDIHTYTHTHIHMHTPDRTWARLALPQVKFQRPSNVLFLLLMSRHYLEKKRINLLRILAARPARSNSLGKPTLPRLTIPTSFIHVLDEYHVTTLVLFRHCSFYGCKICHVLLQLSFESNSLKMHESLEWKNNFLTNVIKDVTIFNTYLCLYHADIYIIIGIE